jgi:hypothetical protein
MNRKPRNDHLDVEVDDVDVEVWEPQALEDRVASVRPRRFRTRLTASVPGAIGGVLLVSALAFGATLQSSAPFGGAGAGDAGTGAADGGALADHETSTVDGTTDGDHTGADAEPGAEEPGAEEPGDMPGQPPIADEPPTAEPTPAHEADGTPKPERTEPTAKPAEKPAPKPADKPEPKPTPRPTAKPVEIPALGMTVVLKDGRVYIDWTACKVDGADYYKVVRSTDETVRWPAGDGDTLIAAIEVGGNTATWDEHAPAGKKSWYRVFCVRHSGDGYKVLTASPVRAITAPAEEPAPTPDTCDLSLDVAADGGNAVLHWTGCDSTQFSHYRIVRTSGDATKVVTEIENRDTTSWTDDSVEAGATYRYQVQAKGVIEGSYVLLGATDFAEVTIG